MSKLSSTPRSTIFLYLKTSCSISLDWSLQIFLAEDTVLDMKDLGVLPYLHEVRVDDVDEEIVLGELGEAMAPKSAKSFPGRYKPKEKTHEIARYGAGTIRENI